MSTESYEGHSANPEHDRQRALETIVDLALRHGIDSTMINEAIAMEVAQRRADEIQTNAETDAAAQGESITPIRQETEGTESHWAELIARTEPPLLVGKFDPRLFGNGPLSQSDRPTVVGFGSIRPEPNGEYSRQTGFAPGGDAVLRTLQKIRDSSEAAGGARRNTLLFYYNAPTDSRDGEPRVVHFAYESIMARERDIDNRTGKGNAVTLYGTLPAESLNEFWAKLRETPELIDEILKDLYEPFFANDHFLRKKAEELAMGYVEGIGRGVDKHPSNKRDVREYMSFIPFTTGVSVGERDV